MRSKLALATLALSVTLAAAALAGATMREDGVHIEPWFKNPNSFLILAEDAQEAKAAGKGLVVIWEQKGCDTCQRLHEVNFADAKLAGYIKDRFDVLVMNLYGEVEVTDFDGAKLAEKELAAKHRVNFTPTTIFFDAKGAEQFRLPGYMAPFTYLSGYVFVAEKGTDNPEFKGMLPRWLKANGEKVRSILGRGPEG